MRFDKTQKLLLISSLLLHPKNETTSTMLRTKSKRHSQHQQGFAEARLYTK